MKVLTCGEPRRLAVDVNPVGDVLIQQTRIEDETDGIHRDLLMNFSSGDGSYVQEVVMNLVEAKRLQRALDFAIEKIEGKKEKKVEKAPTIVAMGNYHCD